MSRRQTAGALVLHLTHANAPTMLIRAGSLIGTCVLLLAGCARTATHRLPATVPAANGPTQTLFTLRYIDVVEGTGDPVVPGSCVFAHYTGWLTDGTQFDSSRDTTRDGAPRAPLGFPQGARRVIAGWDLGFEGMRIGGKRRLFIPYQLAYGERGRPPRIPPRSELIFDVELMAVSDTIPRPQGAPNPQCPTWDAVRPTR